MKMYEGVTHKTFYLKRVNRPIHRGEEDWWIQVFADAEMTVSLGYVEDGTDPGEIARIAGERWKELDDITCDADYLARSGRLGSAATTILENCFPTWDEVI